MADALEHCVGTPVLVVPGHLLQQLVVEALDADTEPLDTVLERIDRFVGDVVGARLGRDLADARIERPGQVDRLAELIDQDGRRAAADVQCTEFIAVLRRALEFGTQRAEVVTRSILTVQESVEAAVRTQPLAERDVDVQGVCSPWFGVGQTCNVHGMLRHVATVEHTERPGQHAFGKHGMHVLILPTTTMRRAVSIVLVYDANQSIPANEASGRDRRTHSGRCQWCARRQPALTGPAGVLMKRPRCGYRGRSSS